MGHADLGDAAEECPISNQRFSPMSVAIHEACQQTQDFRYGGYMKGLLLIPALNEQHSIGEVVRAAKARIADILVVDDGSSDLTQAAAAAAGAIVLRLETNMGKGEALKVGFRYALEHDCDWVVTMDGDGQHDPEDLVNFLPLLGSYD